MVVADVVDVFEGVEEHFFVRAGEEVLGVLVEGVDTFVWGFELGFKGGDFLGKVIGVLEIVDDFDF